MITITAILNAIEVRTEQAIVQELQVMRREVERLRPVLNLDDQEHADTLLLKIDRLIEEQIVIPRQSASSSSEVPAVLAA